MENHEILGEVGNTLKTLNENVPTHVKAGFYKALVRLGSALIDVPIAKLEGFAQEIRATTQSRESLVRKVGEEIKSNIETSKEYSDYAVKMFSEKILRKQINIDAVTSITASEINNTIYNANDQSSKELSDEWLDEFEEICRNKSSDDMRMIFGKILAQEIRNPGFSSIKTLKTISQLDRDIAEYFLQFSRICVHVKRGDQIVAVFAPEFKSGPFNIGDFTEFNIAPAVVILLKEFGLVSDSSDYSIVFDSSEFSDNIKGIHEFYMGDKKVYVQKKNSGAKDLVHMNGQIFSTAGKDLYSIIRPDFNIAVENKLNDYFNEEGYNLVGSPL
ncbi:DUF2806 domain-containing protein [uncultured Chryseobacterium sp.]|uniref:DUF2806 domain-containing protein n=1 Tax=uncultured Chryseobacterium sp. TaxID=259322 RepID=UPI0025FFA891|nr:DUF2806 domain-containing protein [uncultured Chryseobacterium sp.]